MTMAARQLGQAHAVGFNQTYTGFLRALDELTHARITPRGFKINFNNRLWCRFEADTHGMETE
jgi:hypothetical protein